LKPRTEFGGPVQTAEGAKGAEGFSPRRKRTPAVSIPETTVAKLHRHQRQLELYVRGYVALKKMESNWPKLRRATLDDRGPDDLGGQLDEIEILNDEIGNESGDVSALKTYIGQVEDFLTALSKSKNLMREVRTHPDRTDELKQAIQEMRGFSESMRAAAKQIEADCVTKSDQELIEVRGLVDSIFGKLRRPVVEQVVQKDFVAPVGREAQGSDASEGQNLGDLVGPQVAHESNPSGPPTPSKRGG
jgi:hypothetical protein